MKKGITIILAVLMAMNFAAAQSKFDQERMDRDIEIAENALATLIKQGMNTKAMWVEVKATYTPGYGVTMRIPNENTSWIYESWGLKGRAMIAPPGAAVVVMDADDKEKDREKARSKRLDSRDSAMASYYEKMIKASKDFIVDYGDLISQLQPDEKILITNRGEGRHYYYDYGGNGSKQKRMLVTIEGTKGDISQFRQGKLTRDQAISKLKVVNTESVNEVETDLELYSSIIERLYRSDLSKTFYTDENIYYERMKDFGVIYYMSAYSGQEQNRRPTDSKDLGKIWMMPTQHLEGLTQEQRDKKVIELYPKFEKELEENLIEYAQTVKSLKDEEMFVFNVNITKCAGCGIPSTLELSFKNGNVRKLATGQMSKADVVNSINVKRGPNQ